MKKTEKQPKNAASNTREAFEELIGAKIVGILHSALPVGRRDLAAGNTTLVLSDGSGFTFSSSGSFWRESEDEIRRAVRLKRQELATAKRELDGVLMLAGM